MIGIGSFSSLHPSLHANYLLLLVSEIQSLCLMNLANDNQEGFHFHYLFQH